MGWSSQAVTAVEFIGEDFEINENGAFFYNGPAAAGTLALSITQYSGIDGHGNHYLAGTTQYSGAPGFYVALNLDDGFIQWAFTADMTTGWSVPNFAVLGVSETITMIQTTLLMGSGVFAVANDPDLDSGNPETWHDLAFSGPGTFSGLARYMLTVDNCVRIQVNGDFSADGTYTADVDSLYAPVNGLNWPVYGGDRANIAALGTTLTVFSVTAGATVGFCQDIPLN
jgi:hypothetical protein